MEKGGAGFRRLKLEIGLSGCGQPADFWGGQRNLKLRADEKSEGRGSTTY